MTNGRRGDERTCVRVGVHLTSSVRGLQQVRNGECDENDDRPDDDVEHEVVRGGDDRERHRERHCDREDANGPVLVAWKRTIPTRRFQPKCRLGSAAYWFVSAAAAAPGTRASTA